MSARSLPDWIPATLPLSHPVFQKRHKRGPVRRLNTRSKKLYGKVGWATVNEKELPYHFIGDTSWRIVYNAIPPEYLEPHTAHAVRPTDMATSGFMEA